MMSDRQIGPVFHVILLAVFIRSKTATRNCLINVYSRHESDIKKRCLWEHCVEPNMKDFATSLCYHVVMTYVCLDSVLG